ncbi:MAG: hypothetical protein VYE68_11235 [Acidobacteriota bacterium]|nr:hypothetical protein [Acidobacteriota bacterium]
MFRGWAVVGGLALFLLAPVVSPGFGLPLAQSGPSFSPTDSLAIQLVEPRLGTSDSPGWLASTLVSRVWLLAPLGNDASRLAALALVAGVVTALVSFFFYRGLGMSFAPAAGGALAVTAGAVAPVVSTGDPDALMACLAVAVIWGGCRRPTTAYLGWPSDA